MRKRCTEDGMVEATTLACGSDEDDEAAPEERSRKGLSIGCLLFVLFVVAILRVNLPPNDVSSSVDLSELESEDWFTRVAGGTFVKLLVTDAVAGWEYRDFLVFKIADSKRLEIVALGFPFCKWHIFTYEEFKG